MFSNGCQISKAYPTTEQGAQKEAGERASAAEEKFSKLREVYQKLRSEHITLLRKSGDQAKLLAVANKSVTEHEDQVKVHSHTHLVMLTFYYESKL